jgi:hypothetical protein
MTGFVTVAHVMAMAGVGKPAYFLSLPENVSFEDMGVCKR